MLSLPLPRAGTDPHRRLVAAWSLLVLVGAALLGAAAAGVPAPSLLPERIGLDGLGATTVATAYAAALGLRVGGRPRLGVGFALVLAVLALTTGTVELRGGAAVMTAVLGSVLGVMATRPAKTFLRTLRELALAMVLAGLGGVAAVGFRPTLEIVRFQYVVLGLAFLLLGALVYRLGAGFHGLGGRGLFAVLTGIGIVIVTLAYTELLRRYATPGVATGMVDVGAWVEDLLGGKPRPLQAFLGIPALVWGCHLRARRRQGWWVCAFGIGATAPLAALIADPAMTISEVALTELLSVLLGLVLGYLVIRLDLFFTGPRGRRARRAEEAAALRPEPTRARPLL